MLGDDGLEDDGVAVAVAVAVAVEGGGSSFLDRQLLSIDFSSVATASMRVGGATCSETQPTNPYNVSESVFEHDNNSMSIIVFLFLSRRENNNAGEGDDGCWLFLSGHPLMQKAVALRRGTAARANSKETISRRVCIASATRSSNFVVPLATHKEQEEGGTESGEKMMIL
jgi:hypothetical protein